MKNLSALLITVLVCLPLPVRAGETASDSPAIVLAEQSSNFEWQDITNNLIHGNPSSYVHSISPHSFFGDSVWIGTKSGAYFSAKGGKRWGIVRYGDHWDAEVTETVTMPNTLVDCLCSLVGLGTSEPSADSTEMRGRVYRSLIDGINWENTEAPELAVTALTYNYWNPFVMYAGLYSTSSQEGSLFRLGNSSGWKKIEILDDVSLITRKINCIAIDPADTNKIFVGTERGLYFTHDNSQSWHHVLQSFNIVTILISRDTANPEMYAATSGRSRSDGIYASRSNGKEWEVVSWRTDIVELAVEFPYFDDPGVSAKYYMAAYNQGVFESRDRCRNWNDISMTLKDKNITALATIPGKRGQLYLGCERGIYRYGQADPVIDLRIEDQDLAYWPPEPKDGELIEIYASIKNESPQDVFDVEVSFVDNADGMLTVIVPIDTLIIPHILPHSEYTLRAEWYPQGQAGGNIIFVQVDPRNKISERIENNNFAKIDINLEEPPHSRLWQNINRDLPDTWVNDIAGHPFQLGTLYVATNDGAYWSNIRDRHWNQIKFDAHNDVRISQITADMHPYLDWTEPVLWIATEEYSDIPEDRTGRVFRSEDGGYSWNNMRFPEIAVSTLYVPQQNSLLAYAAAYNPFYYLDSFYFYKEDGWLEHDMTPGDSVANRINCFAVENPESSKLYIGSVNGLYVYNTIGNSMFRTLDNLNVVSIVLTKGYRSRALYAATRGEQFCDGVYQSLDDGMHWRKIADYKNIAALEEASKLSIPLSAAPHLYLAVYDQGVLESRNGGRSWQDITNNLDDLKIISIAVDQHNPELVYLGTENGIYWFDDPTVTATPEAETKPPIADNFSLFQNYPNPFNNSTVITYSAFANHSNETMDIHIYNSIGQLVKTLVTGQQPTAGGRVIWDGVDDWGKVVPSGLYIGRLLCGANSDYIKLLFLQ